MLDVPIQQSDDPDLEGCESLSIWFPLDLSRIQTLRQMKKDELRLILKHTTRHTSTRLDQFASQRAIIIGDFNNSRNSCISSISQEECAERNSLDSLRRSDSYTNTCTSAIMRQDTTKWMLVRADHFSLSLDLSRERRIRWCHLRPDPEWD